MADAGARAATSEPHAPDARPPGAFLLVSPMHIVSLSERSWGVRLAQRLHGVSQKWFTHVLLFLFLVAYALSGALVFRLLEGPYEHRAKDGLRAVRRRVVDDLYRECGDEARWKKLAQRRLFEYEAQMRLLCQAGITTDSERELWTFWGAMFYCGTVFTTIGYGNIAPSTNAGRAATIAYAFFGIPLLLMVLADLGKLFTRLIKLAFVAIRRVYDNKNVRMIRKASYKATRTPRQLLVSWRGHPTSHGVPSSETRPIQVPINEEQRARVPVSLVLLFLAAYMTLGAFGFSLWEGWSFFEAFYFVFVSMSTIGFGDYVPKHPMFMMVTFVYLLFGLALTSMCINVIQEKLSATFQKARDHIGVSLGLGAEDRLIGAYLTPPPREPLEDKNGGGGGVSAALAFQANRRPSLTARPS
ncbi:potassium channel subfamily K member 18 [Ixodes scapularis]|uniref:potassium channel subfamily K member 18 n=1 Tax=Ixodes scapularis TaxID=6945 RepID=UPI001C39436C|nr:potassium channel subfamily K member 18 [Ixodes scapularis]